MQLLTPLNVGLYDLVVKLVIVSVLEASFAVTEPTEPPEIEAVLAVPSYSFLMLLTLIVIFSAFSVCLEIVSVNDASSNAKSDGSTEDPSKCNFNE